MSFATLDELKLRLEWELDADEERIATSALEDLSDEACFYGIDSWTDLTAPRAVKKQVLKAAVRYMRNPDGYEQSRAGDETLQWGQRSEQDGTAHFVAAEIDIIKSYSKKSPGFGTFSVYAFRNKPLDTTGYVPVEGGGDPFPYFAGSDEW